MLRALALTAELSAEMRGPHTLVDNEAYWLGVMRRALIHLESPNLNLDVGRRDSFIQREHLSAIHETHLNRIGDLES